MRKPASTPTTASNRCVDLYLSSQSNPSSYPCTECLPTLSTNDTSPVQLCAMMEVWSAMGQSQADGVDKWGKNGNVCEWNGVECDKGSVTSMWVFM
jgi:hypothetical protein